MGPLFLPELQEIRPQKLPQEYRQLALQFRNEAEQVLHHPVLMKDQRVITQDLSGEKRA